nr:SDR family oxidoreductase [Ruegeria sp. Ofav3-42]
MFLVTGAGGYIGCVLTDELLERGASVRALDRFFFGQTLLKDGHRPERLTLMRKDIRDVSAADFDGVDAVLDLAALSNDPSGDLAPELTWDINSLGRKHMVHKAKEAGVPRFVMSSTCSVYGAAGDGISTEESPVNPVSVYANSNYEAETEVLSLNDDGFTTAALRNATVFGLSRRMRFDLVVNLMTLSAFERGQITIMGGGRQWRPLVHVKDVARGLIALAVGDKETVGGKAYNIGCGNYQVMTIAAIVREILPFQVQLQVAPDDVDRRNYRVSFDRLENDLGFEPTQTLEDAVAEIYDALKMGRIENGPRCSTVNWYRHILDARALLDEIELDGRLL